MIERKFITLKKQEYAIKEFIKNKFGQGKVSEIKIERTPIGEKIIIVTSRPGLIIGRAGQHMQELMEELKKMGLENPQIEVSELNDPFDAQTIADRIALALKNIGPLKFKLIAYRELEKLFKAGALGAEIRLSGKLPSERARSWRFAFGYLKKTGSVEVVKKAQAIAYTKPGVIGVKVLIVPKDAKIPDRIEINKEKIEAKLRELIAEEEKKNEKEKKENK